MANYRYAGISPYTSKQSDIFFGRDKDIEELYEQILLETQVLLYAKSGVGKSSVMNAGVLPKLKKNKEYKAVRIRFRAYNDKDRISPVQRLIGRLDFQKEIDFEEKTILEQIEADQEKTLWYYFKKIQLLKPELKLILIFDQFEELFTYPQEQIDDFKEQLSEILKPEVPAKFVDIFSDARRKDRKLMNRDMMNMLNKSIQIKSVYIIRSDRLSELNQMRDRIPDIQKSFYELKALSNEQAREAIICPAKNDGNFATPKFGYEEEAIKKIIKFLTKNYEEKIETTQLQIICQRIEENLPKTEAGYQVSENDIPDFKNIFLEFYISAINSLEEKYRDSARRLIENQLIRSKQRISLDGNVCIEYLPDEILMKLVNNHLLRAERNTVGGFSYELSHDTLVLPIYEAAEKRRQREEEEKAQAEREEELRIAKEKAEKERIESEKERKRQKQIIRVISMAAIVSVAFAVFGFIMWQKAKEQARIAMEKTKIAEEKTLIAKESEAKIKNATINYYFENANTHIERADYQKALDVYKMLQDSIMGGMSNERLQKAIADCKNKMGSQSDFIEHFKNAEKEVSKKDFKQAVEYFGKALETGIDNEKVKSRLKDVQKIVDAKAAENRDLEQALSYNIANAAPYRNIAIKYENISKTISNLLKE